MKLTSPEFENNQIIPTSYTGMGENKSPPLYWSHAPGNCKEFALICEDLDSPRRSDTPYPFIHWVVYHISAAAYALPEGLSEHQRMESPVAIDQGLNSLGKTGYTGPLPPPGESAHHYHFKLYALDKELALLPGASRAHLLDAMKGHILATAELVGTFARDAVKDFYSAPIGRTQGMFNNLEG